MLFQYRNTADAHLICLQCKVLTEINVWQISEAFKRFGISDSDSAVHIVLVYNKDETLNIEDIISKVDGEQMAVDRVSDLTDAAKIKKVCLLLHRTDVEQVGFIAYCTCLKWKSVSLITALQSRTTGGKVWQSFGRYCLQDGH